MQYDHHPDPAIAFCVEVERLEGAAYDVKVGLTRREAVLADIERALQFRVGGDPQAVEAKAALRRLAAELRVS